MKSKIVFELTDEEKEAIKEAIDFFKLRRSHTVRCTIEHQKFCGRIQALEGILNEDGSLEKKGERLNEQEDIGDRGCGGV